MLDRPIGDEHGGFPFGNFHERPAFAAQARHDYGLALGGEPGERLARRGAVKRALELAACPTRRCEPLRRPRPGSAASALDACNRFPARTSDLPEACEGDW